MQSLKTMVVAVGLGLALLGAAQAAPLQLALWPSEWQMVAEDQDISGVRLEVYGRNKDVSGFELGFAHETTGHFSGVSLGLVSLVGKELNGVQWEGIFAKVGERAVGWSSAIYTKIGGDLDGLQTGIVNSTDGETHGVQLAGVFSRTGKHISGGQLGLVNYAASVKGLQFGLVNLAGDMNGIQIGLWNQIDSKDTWKVIPLVNWKF